MIVLATNDNVHCAPLKQQQELLDAYDMATIRRFFSCRLLVYTLIEMNELCISKKLMNTMVTLLMQMFTQISHVMTLIKLSQHICEVSLNYYDINYCHVID